MGTIATASKKGHTLTMTVLSQEIIGSCGINTKRPLSQYPHGSASLSSDHLKVVLTLNVTTLRTKHPTFETLETHNMQIVLR